MDGQADNGEPRNMTDGQPRNMKDGQPENRTDGQTARKYNVLLVNDHLRHKNQNLQHHRRLPLLGRRDDNTIVAPTANGRGTIKCNHFLPHYILWERGEYNVIFLVEGNIT